jgi:hypothetical protein
MSEQGPQRPTSDEDSAGWKAYWAAQGMPWRTEPETSEQRSQPSMTAITKRSNDLDESAPTPERQAESNAAYAANSSKGFPPYMDVEIRTKGELLWILHTWLAGWHASD